MCLLGPGNMFQDIALQKLKAAGTDFQKTIGEESRLQTTLASEVIQL